MIIGRLPEVTTENQAIQMLVGAITISSTAIIASIGISYCGPAMMSAAVDNPRSFTTNILGLVLSEALAIYGLLISFMLIG